jgi:hypothetical protein
MFRRKKWRYLILDEAHMIKNWKSQRWQTLLRFNSKRRLLITGTPLQVGRGGGRGGLRRRRPAGQGARLQHCSRALGRLFLPR